MFTELEIKLPKVMNDLKHPPILHSILRFFLELLVNDVDPDTLSGPLHLGKEI